MAGNWYLSQCLFYAGAVCPQNMAIWENHPTLVIKKFTNISEDCLYLNVWTPTLNSKTNKPVMVSIHGGGFTSGTCSKTFFQLTEFFHSVKVVYFDSVKVMYFNQTHTNFAQHILTMFYSVTCCRNGCYRFCRLCRHVSWNCTRIVWWCCTCNFQL